MLADVRALVRRLGRSSSGAGHDYRPRRLELSREERNALAPVAFRSDADGAVDVLLLPNFGCAYAARLSDELAAALLPALSEAAAAMLPLVLADGDPGPLGGLAS